MSSYASDAMEGEQLQVNDTHQFDLQTPFINPDYIYKHTSRIARCARNIKACLSKLPALKFSLHVEFGATSQGDFPRVFDVIEFNLCVFFNRLCMHYIT